MAQISIARTGKAKPLCTVRLDWATTTRPWGCWQKAPLYSSKTKYNDKGNQSVRVRQPFSQHLLVLETPKTGQTCTQIAFAHRRPDLAALFEDFLSVPWDHRAPLDFGPVAERVIITTLLCAKRYNMHLPPELWQEIFSYMCRVDFSAV
eukprot:m.72558 g.72558  ORF g.72558 m.72558 type:complete len:149 (-) comp8000_c0_seq4:53-499(-)